MVKGGIEAPLGLVCFGNCRSGAVVPAQLGGAVAPAGLGGPQGLGGPSSAPVALCRHLWAPAGALGTSRGSGPAPPCRTPLLRGHGADETESCTRCFITQFLFSFPILSSAKGNYFTLFSFPTTGAMGTGQGCFPRGFPAPLRSLVPSTNPPGQGQDLWIHTFLMQKHLLISVFSSSSPPADDKYRNGRSEKP